MSAQRSDIKLLAKPFENKVFIEEQGQFTQRAVEQEMQIPGEILYAVKNAEFTAWFTRGGVVFQYPERIPIDAAEHEEEYEREQGEEYEEELGKGKKVETVWHYLYLEWVGAGQPQIKVNDKAHEYYNYGKLMNGKQYSLIPAYHKLTYEHLYPGVDVEFELPEEGGLKYRFLIKPNVEIPDIGFRIIGADDITLDQKGILHFSNRAAHLVDNMPNAQTLVSGEDIPVKYGLTDNVVKFQFEEEKISSEEGIVIDPWITNTNYPTINRAFDIQEDAAGNVLVLGNHTNYQVQKYSPAGVLQWTYSTYSVFLGDIATDNPGNTYVVGDYSTGKRQKLDPNGVQQWIYTGLTEEWRLAFNYSKTILTEGGYFINNGQENLANLDVNSGAISNLINYGAETRSIATDCNGDIYSLHVTFGATGNAATNVIRKTNADYTPGGSVLSGFSMPEVEPLGIGYAPCPAYGPQIYQGFNGIIVNGPFIYIYNGTDLRRFNKSTLTFLNNTTVPGSVYMMNSGLATDLCGNLYVGTQNGIAKFDSLLNFIGLINTPGPVYDVLLTSTGDLLACGEGFIGSFDVDCVEPPPLTASANDACEQVGTVTITADGGIPPYSYEWQPGGYTTSSVSGLTPGTYTYTVSDRFCNTYQNTATIYPKPVVDFEASINNNSGGGCEGEATQFTDNSTTSSGTITGWEWEFGDGGTDNTQNPTNTYATAGTYNVTLIVTSDQGCMDTNISPVIINPPPVANFTTGPACLGDATSFTDGSSVSSGNIVGWDWDFGDGNTDNTQNPTHTYANAGAFDVELTVTSDSGCTATSSVVVADVYDLPTAAFSASAVCDGIATQFTDESTTSQGSISSWTWDFGDGNTSNLQSPSHTYATAGTYTVTLTASTGANCSNMVSNTVTVNPLPTADFSFTDDCMDNGIGFTDMSSVTNSTITGWDWDFGDGSVHDNNQSPYHTYTSSGQFNVTLEVTSAEGCIASVTMQPTVYPEPEPDFTAVDACLGTPVDFQDNSNVSTGNIAQWDWDLGDGNTANTQNTSNDYVAAGTYNVMLSVVTDNGCTGDITLPVEVFDLPVADFTATEVCESNPTVFTDNSTLPVGNNQWDWDYGDGTTHGTAQSPSHTYTSAGSYNAALTVTTADGCTDDETYSVNVFPGVTADFGNGDECLSEDVSFTDLSTVNSGNITGWDWDFGDGNSSTQQHPNHGYQSAGTYTVSLTATSNNGCTGTYTADATVYPMPAADFTATFVCEGLMTDFTDASDISSGTIDSYTWDYSDGNGDNVASPSYTFAAAGNYNVELLVASDQGCLDSITKVVEVYPLPVVLFEAIPDKGCMPLEIQFNDLSTVATGSNANWNWEVEGQNSSTQQNPSYTFNTNGSFDVSLTVTSDQGCITKETIEDFVTVYPLPGAKFLVNPEETEINFPEVTFTDLSTGSPIAWSWEFGTGNGSNEQNPAYSYPDTGLYNVLLEITDANGCIDTAWHTVLITPSFTIYVPSAFTPGRNALNDLFIPKGVGDWNQYEFRIFSRWGEQVFETFDPSVGWDGTIRGSSELAKEDVYVWRISLIDYNGESKNMIGSVTLIR